MVTIFIYLETYIVWGIGMFVEQYCFIGHKLKVYKLEWYMVDWDWDWMQYLLINTV